MSSEKESTFLHFDERLQSFFVFFYIVTYIDGLCQIMHGKTENVYYENK